MVIHSEDLKERPQEVLPRIHAFIGVPDHDYPFLHEGLSEELHDIVTQKYPTFENMTGWRLESDHEPMPQPIRSEMTEFYRPHNEMLFRMLGREFPKWLG
eukprot:TRINITY_DN6176_c0_g1_i4.p4 TRINITY_DN6176_c0_g1~~TRINITY_DN6176_c0_g1_i4.p4  ORF type:complete len:100 (-),score=29.58 TRINITY_DN6176_c0_g1_i4:828-1127(-)